MKVKIIVFVTILLIAGLTLIYSNSSSNNFADEYNTDTNQQTQKSKNSKPDAKIEKLLDKLEATKSWDFQYLGVPRKYYKTMCDEIVQNYIQNDPIRLIDWYPNKSFYRLTRHCCFYNRKLLKGLDEKYLEIIKKDWRIELTCYFNYKSKDAQEKEDDRIKYEKIDTLLLFISLHPKILKSFTELEKAKIVLWSTLRFSIKDTRLDSANQVLNNLSPYLYEVAIKFFYGEFDDLINEPSISELIVNEYVKKKYYLKIFIDNFLFPYYESTFKENLFKLYDYLLESYIELAEYFREKTNLLFDYEDFFEKYLLDENDDWRIFDYRRICNDEARFHLTYRKYRVISQIYRSKKVLPGKILKRILCFIYWYSFDWVEINNSSENYQIYKPTITDIKNNIYDEDTTKKELLYILKRSIKLVETKGFIEPFSKVIYLDDRSDFPSIDNTVEKCKMLKWRFGDIGYGSPTYPTECFIDWDKHKAKFPEYEKMRKQVLSDK